EGSPGVSADGNIMSLINFSNLSDYCFYGLFKDCKSLTSAPILPASAMRDRCYMYMFTNCSSLTVSPILPSENLFNSCYAGMFQNTGIRVAPRLPATTLADNCYSGMFSECSFLKEAPELPAFATYFGCYGAMFFRCTSLRRAPLIDLKSFGTYSFAVRMFAGCTSLSYIKVCFEEPMLSSNPTEFRLMGWVSGVAPQGTFVCPKLCADKDTYSDFSNKTIPVGWTIDNDMSY
ncbi:MAG: hypothetical protein MJ208_03675, partial [Bacilli bacterium]|nr:hypothetical protein [Bacilli bacterium]